MLPTPETIHWGETLCLDYANSVYWSSEDEHVDPEQTDVLLTQDMLGRWGRRLDLLSEDAKPASAAELRRARALETLSTAFSPRRSRDQKPAGKDLDALMSNYIEALKQRLSAGRRGTVPARLAGTGATKESAMPSPPTRSPCLRMPAA